MTDRICDGEQLRAALDAWRSQVSDCYAQVILATNAARDADLGDAVNVTSAYADMARRRDVVRAHASAQHEDRVRCAVTERLALLHAWSASVAAHASLNPQARNTT